MRDLAQQGQGEELVGILSPEPAGEAAHDFNPLRPTSQSSLMSEADQAKLVQKALVADTVVPAIMKGKKDFTKKSPILDCAATEIRESSTALMALLTEAHGPSGSEAVQGILSAKLGVKMLVKQAGDSAEGTCHDETHVARVAVPGMNQDLSQSAFQLICSFSVSSETCAESLSANPLDVPETDFLGCIGGSVTLCLKVGPWA